MVEVYLYLFNIHTFIHKFFFVLWGGASVGRCAFLFLGIDVSVVNCVWKILVALKRAGFGATCVG